MIRAAVKLAYASRIKNGDLLSNETVERIVAHAMAHPRSYPAVGDPAVVAKLDAAPPVTPLDRLRELSEAATQGRIYYSRNVGALRADQGKRQRMLLDGYSTISARQDEKDGDFAAAAMNYVREVLSSPSLQAREWMPISTAPIDVSFLALVEGDVRVVRWGKTSHVPLYGWCLADQGAEDFDLCQPTLWQPMPLPPAPSADRMPWEDRT
jgi:hypothetical protein